MWRLALFNLCFLAGQIGLWFALEELFVLPDWETFGLKGLQTRRRSGMN